MEDNNSNHIILLNKLADIQTSLAINTTETKNIRDGVGEIKTDLKEVKQKVEFQNGRVRKLEDWTKEAQTIIENNSKGVNSLIGTRKVVWAAIAILVAVGGTIITLAIMAIDSKIKTGIDSALSIQYEITHEENNSKE